MTSPFADRLVGQVWSLASGAGSFPAAILAGLLPRRWREALHIRDESSAMRFGVYLSGVTQALVCFGFWFLLATKLGQTGFVDLSTVSEAEAEFLTRLAIDSNGFLDPRGWVLLWFSLEGCLRIGAAGGGYIFGLSPLWALAEVDATLARWRAEKQKLPLLPDCSSREGEGWLIESSHPKPWGETCTIRIDDALFHLAQERHFGDSTHPYHYHLAPISPGWLVRRVEVWPDLGDPE